MASERLILLGVNHKTTPIEIREKVALSAGYEEPLKALRQVSNLKECYLLSTCNRVEMLAYATPTAELEEELISFLFGANASGGKFREYIYLYHGSDAVHHLFTVAASLDSLVVGEAQILGQLKEAYRHASALHLTGPLLNRLLHKSFSVAKRVRTETGIGSSAVSISTAAVELARKIFGNLTDKRVLLIGAGEMAELAAQHLVGQGVKEVVVANRTLSRAVDLARNFNGKAIAFEELDSSLEQADIIISSTGADSIILEQEQVRPVMRKRRNKPLFFIDIAVPRDLDPKLNDLENVYLYDIDDLSQVVEMNRSERDKEALKAGRIVDEETLKFARWSESLELTPTIQDLRRRLETISDQEMAKTMAKISGLSDVEKASIAKMVGAITAKMLHQPLRYLKSDDCGGRDNTQLKVETIRSVFGLDQNTDK